jgi:hypothetical protein
MLNLEIIFLQVDNAHPLVLEGEAVPSQVRKRALRLEGIPAETALTPDWCYAQIEAAYPETAEYTIAIWGVDVEPQPLS